MIKFTFRIAMIYTLISIFTLTMVLVCHERHQLNIPQNNLYVINISNEPIVVYLSGINHKEGNQKINDQDNFYKVTLPYSYPDSTIYHYSTFFSLPNDPDCNLPCHFKLIIECSSGKLEIDKDNFYRMTIYRQSDRSRILYISDDFLKSNFI